MKLPVLSLLLIFFSCAASAQSNNGLIAHWKMNGNAADSSGKGHHGTIWGATPDTGKSGIPNTAMHFNGSSYITVPHHADWNMQRYSICAVVKADSFNHAICEGNTIISRGKDNVAGHFVFNYHDNNSTGCGVFDSTAFNFNTGVQVKVGSSGYTPGIQLKTWYSVVALYDSLQVRIYVDGVLKHTVSAPSPIGSSSDSLFIGKDGYGAVGYAYPMIGSIGDLRIYNRRLSDSEIVAYTGTPDLLPTTNVSELTYSIAGKELSVFPNPARDMISIQAPIAEHTEWEVLILDQLGRKAGRYVGREKGMTIDVSKLNAGIYHISVHTPGGVFTKRFEKLHQ